MYLTAPYLLTLLMLSPSVEIVRWIAESKRPFQIVNDRGFQSLMKTGRPGYQIPSAETVSRDMKRVLTNVRQRIAKMLQVISASLQKNRPMAYLEL